MRMALNMAAIGLLTGVLFAGQALADRTPEEIVRDRCQDCHGMTGQSSDPEYPKLAGQNADYMTRQLANFKTGVRVSRKMQRKVEDLTGHEMRALAEYYAAQRLVPDIAFDPALAQVGREFYFSGNADTGVSACVTCHGPEGRGAMYLPRLAGQHRKYIIAQLHAFREHSRSSSEMVMHSVVENISEDEIVAVAHFLSGLE